MRTAFTAAIWTLSLASLGLAGVIAGGLALIAFSLDPSDIITAGLEPYTDALIAAGAFLALLVVTLLSLRLWHSVRFRVASVILTFAEVACVGWACARVYRDYF